MIKFDDNAWAALIATAKSRKVMLSGNILKIIDDEGRDSYKAYLAAATEKDAARRRQRLDVNIKTQSIMAELKAANEENEQLMSEVREALATAETARSKAEESRKEACRLREEAEDARKRAEMAKETAEMELDTVQKRKQFQLVGNIVQVALIVICGVGLITTALYGTAIVYGSDEAQLLGNTWSNMFGILLTNSFSIIGTVMGVKYASERSDDSAA